MATQEPGPDAEPVGPEAVQRDVTEATGTEATREGAAEYEVTELDVTEAVVTPPSQPVPPPPAWPGAPASPGQPTYPPPYPRQPYPQPPYSQQPYAEQAYPQQYPNAQPDASQQTYGQTPYYQPPYTQPQYPQSQPTGQPYAQSPYAQPPYYGWATPLPAPPPRPRTPPRAIVTALAIVLIIAGAVAGGLELAKPTSGSTAQPTTGSAAQDAAARAVWRTTPVNQLLPPTITREGTESYIRLGINPDQSCATLPSAFTAALAPTKCAHLLTATYVDRTQTVTATVGIVVISGTIADRLHLFQVWNADVNADKAAMMPHVYAVPHTVASAFTDGQRVAWQSQLATDGTYLAYAVTGFTDGRVGPNTADLGAGLDSALSTSSPAVQVAGDLPAAIQSQLASRLQAAQSTQGGAS